MTNFFSRIRILPRWIIVLIDIAVLAISVFLAYLLRFNFDYAKLHEFDANRGILIFTAFGTLSCLITRNYAGIIRYTGLQDTGRNLTTMIFTGLFMVAVNSLEMYLNGIMLMPYSVLIIALFTALLFLVAYRLGVKELFNFFWSKNTVKKGIVIFGSGKLAQVTRQIIEHDVKGNRKVLAFLDDHRHKIGKVINGIRIINARDDFKKLVSTGSVDELIITDRSMSVERKNELVDICLEAEIKVRMVPPVEHWVNGELKLDQIRDIDIEELLERDSIKLENYNVKKEIKGKKVLITGAAGSIGSEIVRQVLFYRPSTIVMVDQSETGLFDIDNEMESKRGTLKIYPVIGDITNPLRMESIFNEFKPDIIFHAAAYKHVPLMEINSTEAVRCNVGGTKILADMAVKYSAEKFVMISTDKAVNPTSVMGASKRLAEIYVQSLNNFLMKNNPDSTKFITTRFGNVLGSNGSVIPLFKRQIAEGGPITVTHPDIKRYFMTIPEACQLVLEAGAMGKGGEIFVFDMGKSIKIVDLAKKMIQLSGLEAGKDIHITFSGLRQGEKLYEELLSNKENILPTYHHKIMIAETQEKCFNTVKEQTETLINIADDSDELKLVGMMKYILPEFKSNSSQFEKLDQKQYRLGKD